jgi:hypothetical protein
MEVATLVWESPEPRQTGRVNAMWNLLSFGGSSVVANLDTTKLSDDGSTRTVLVVAGVLVVAAFVLIGVTVWFWRNTVPDPDALESLVFFEERVVDGTQDPDVVQRQRMVRTTAEGDRHHGLHLPVRPRRSIDSSADRTETSERTDGRWLRRHRDR